MSSMHGTGNCRRAYRPWCRPSKTAVRLTAETPRDAYHFPAEAHLNPPKPDRVPGSAVQTDKDQRNLTTCPTSRVGREHSHSQANRRTQLRAAAFPASALQKN